MRRRAGLLSCFLAILALTGCEGDSSHGRVSGTVLLDDGPLANAQVEFIPTAGGSTSYGRTDSAGKFTMEYARDSKGASLGENEVRITTGEMYYDGDQETRVQEKVPTQYNAKTELRFVVEQGRNQAEFNLLSQGQIVQTAGDPSEGE